MLAAVKDCITHNRNLNFLNKSGVALVRVGERGGGKEREGEGMRGREGGREGEREGGRGSLFIKILASFPAAQSFSQWLLQDSQAAPGRRCQC